MDVNRFLLSGHHAMAMKLKIPTLRKLAASTSIIVTIQGKVRILPAVTGATVITRSSLHQMRLWWSLIGAQLGQENDPLRLRKSNHQWLNNRSIKTGLCIMSLIVAPCHFRRVGPPFA